MRNTLGVLDSVCKAAAVFAAILTLSIAAVIISEIFARSVFNISFSFAWEYSAYAMGVAMFCGAAFTFRTGGHIRISLLSAALPKKSAHNLDILCTITGTFFSGFISFALCQLAWSSFVSGSTSPSITATPLIIPQGLIALGAVLLTLQLIARLLRLFTGEEPEDTSVSYQVD
jgi:TRAP-type C4-dicarboxylate transport system permease small subunit